MASGGDFSEFVTTYTARQQQLEQGIAFFEQKQINLEPSNGVFYYQVRRLQIMAAS